MCRSGSLPRGSGGFSRRQDTSTEEMTACPRMTSTDTEVEVVALLGGLGLETLVTHPPPHTLPTHSQCPDRQESRHLLLHGLRLQGRSQRSADNPQASHSGRRLLQPRLFQENTTISRISRLQQGSETEQSRR